jgi:hypothetical protein
MHISQRKHEAEAVAGVPERKVGCGGLQSPTTFNIDFRVDLV